MAIVTYLTRHRAQEEIRLRASETIRIYAANLASEISKYEAMPRLLARTPLFSQLLDSPENPELLQQVNLELLKTNDLLGTLDVYILNGDGQAIASSNWDQEQSYIGEDLSFRPYFKDAITAGHGRYFALGTLSQKRGYYFSARIPGDEARATTTAGVMVVKADLQQMEAAWATGHELVTVTDGDDVFFISSNPDWLYHSLKPLTETKLAQIERDKRFPGIVPQSLMVENLETIDASSQNEFNVTLAESESGEQQNYLLLSSDVQSEDWTIQLWNDLSGTKSTVARAQTITLLGLIACFLLAALLLSKLQGRQRQRKMAEDSHNRLQSAYGELELRVQQRTEELSLANSLLRTKIVERNQVETDLRQAQDNLVHAGKMAAIGQMATSITHELNQPLGAIRTFADNASTYLQREQIDEADENLRLISRMTERMNDIMRHLKSFSRKTPLTLQAVNLQSVIDETRLILSSQLENIDLTIHFEQDPATLFVYAESVRLQQVLTNLLSNAIDAVETQDYGCISINTSQPTNNGDVLLLSVKDNGPGIPDEIFNDLFEPFHTQKSSGDGLGLGLAISHSIIREFGGELTASNNADGGACFNVSLNQVVANSNTEPTLKKPASAISG